MFFKAERAPESASGCVVGEDIEGEPGAGWPDRSAEDFKCLPADALASEMGFDEEMTDKNERLVELFPEAKERVSDWLMELGEEDSLMVFLEPAAHSVGEFGQGHGVSIAFVSDEAAVHFGQEWDIQV